MECIIGHANSYSLNLGIFAKCFMVCGMGSLPKDNEAINFSREIGSCLIAKYLKFNLL